jgi:hypothetical protein
VFGLRGPLGAFICGWGGVAMLTSAPFDDWWHNAYGLDVKILSPPHVLLFLGGLAVQIGTLILVLGYMNRAEGALRRKLEWAFLYGGAVILASQHLISMEHTQRVQMHTAGFYFACAVVFPVVLATVARACGTRWAATKAAAMYSLFFRRFSTSSPWCTPNPSWGRCSTPSRT